MIRLAGVRLQPTEAPRRILLDIAELYIRTNEYIGLVGINGSGKSLLLQVMAGLRKPAAGGIAFDEANVMNRRGLVFQSPGDQVVGSTVERDVAFGLENQGVESAEIRRRVADALVAAGLADLARRAPHQLSDGEAQRVALASVLVLEPLLLLLDEPTSRLDPAGRRQFLEEVRKARRRPGTTIVHVTHRLEEMGEMDRVLGLAAGRVVFDGTPEELIARGAESLGVLPAAPAKRAGSPFASRNGKSETPLVEAQEIRWAVSDGVGPPREVLRGVNLALRVGETVGMLGASGAGKTTLAAILADLLEPSSGAVRWSSAASLQGAAPRVPVALVFQDPERGFFEESVLADVAFGPRNLGLSPEAARERARVALARTGLAPEVFGERAPETLSGGEMRRAAIAGILALDACLLILDEPTSGLDAEGCARLRDALAQLRRDGVTLLLISHDLPFLQAECDRIVTLEEGRIREESAPRAAGTTLGAEFPRASATVASIGN